MLDLTWRFIVTNLAGRVVTILDRRSTARKVTYTLNKAALATGTVPSDNPEVNILLGGDRPFLDEGVRNVYGFRKEGGVPTWECRFGGRVLQIEDNVDESSGAPYSNWTAYDPRQLLYTRPCLTADGNLPGPNGVVFDETPADEIVVALIQRSIDAHGELGIDLTGGTIEPCPETNRTFERGLTIGEALDQMAASGACDVLMDPLYEPLAFPGFLASLSVYAQAGSIKRHAIFAWDQPGRSLVGLNRMIDGTQRANRVRYAVGQAGPVVGVVSDFGSVAEYGQYWAEQDFPGESFKDVGEQLAREAVRIRANGAMTLTVNPAPAQATIQTPLLFIDYFLGDEVPLYASSRFRQKLATLQRVYEIPVELRDDGTETISQLSFSDDGVGGTDLVVADDDDDSPPPPATPPPPVVGDTLYEKTWETGNVNEPVDANGFQWGAQAGNFGTPDSATIQRGDITNEVGDADLGSRFGRFSLPADTARRQACELLHGRYADPGVIDFYAFAVRLPSYEFPEFSICQLNYQGIFGSPIHVSGETYIDVEDQAAAKDHASIALLVNSGNIADGPGRTPYYSGRPRGGGLPGFGCRGMPAGTCGPHYLWEQDTIELDVWLENIVAINWTAELDGRVRGWSRVRGGGAFVPKFDVSGAFPTLQWNTGGGISKSSLSHYWTNDKFGAYRQQDSLPFYCDHDTWRRATTFAEAEAAFS